MELAVQFYIAAFAAGLMFVFRGQLPRGTASGWWSYAFGAGFLALLLKSLALAEPVSPVAPLLAILALLCGCAQLYLTSRGVLCLSGNRRIWTLLALAVGISLLAGFTLLSIGVPAAERVSALATTLDLVLAVMCGILALHLWSKRPGAEKETLAVSVVLTLAFAHGIFESVFACRTFFSAPLFSTWGTMTHLIAALGMTFLVMTDAREREGELRSHSDRLQQLVDATDCGICELDVNGRFSFINPAASALLSLAGANPANVHIEEKLQPVDESTARAFSAFILRPTTGLVPAKFDLRGEDGHSKSAQCSVVPVSRDGAISRLVVTLRDITDDEAAHRLLKTRAEVLEMIARNKPVDDVLKSLANAIEDRMAGFYCSILVCDGNSFNVASGDHLPVAYRTALNGLSCDRSAQAAVGESVYWEDTLRSLAQSYGLNGTWVEPLVSGANELLGTIVLNRPALTPLSAGESRTLKDAGRIAGLAVEHRRALERLQHQGYHDALTGLPNRLLFADRLKQALARANRTGRRVALMCIDLDRFKCINDTLGHDTGDLFLQQISVRLASRIRASDTLARTGGDEFMAIVDDVRERGDAEAVANSIRAALEEPFEIDGHTLYGSASIGIAVFPQDGRDTEALQRNADRAMYRAKALGKNDLQLHSSAEFNESNDRIEMEVHLHRALEQGDFMLYFQPQFSCDRRLAGFEALLRFRHPKLGLVPPNRFIPIAEDSGLILPIGEWVLHEACRQIAEWRSKGMRPMRIAVNVSPLQFARSDFSGTVARALEAAKIKSDLLELEITEGVLMSSVNGSARQMDAIAQNGVRLSVDDFGTGYSSLSYLHQLPIQMLKIDRSFIEKICDPGGTRSIVEAIVSLARALGLHTVAEGVETEEQFTILRTIGCDLIQGFLLSRPLPAIEASRLLWQETMAEHGGAMPEDHRILVANSPPRGLAAPFMRGRKKGVHG